MQRLALCGILKRASALCFVLTALAGLGSAATAAPAGHFEWVTLGTQGGPIASLRRGEPANLLVRDGESYLVDAGDGAATRLLAAGSSYFALKGIFISHIHADHVGGLFAVLALRLQTRTVPPLTIYGPPGTRAIVDGLIAAMKPGAEAGFGMPGEVEISPATNLRVVELRGGDTVKLGAFSVTAAANSHYSFPPGSALAAHFQSLSFRFTLTDRSIVYTGDTGPSDAVERLAKGADLLVSEMVDLEAAEKLMARFSAHLSQEERDRSAAHLRLHHLTTEEVGKLAARAGVGKVVMTHIAGGGDPDPAAPARYIAEVQSRFHGPVALANDLDRF